MSRVTVKQMGGNLLYVKYVHSIVADACSLKNGRLCNVIFANYISGVRAFPDKRFSKALTESSKQYEKRFPSLAVPTITMAVRSGSPIVPVALQGLAYSIYVAVIWPSVPLVVETKYIGTVFSVIISVQNTDLVSFTMIIADIYNGRGQQYLPNV